MYPDFDHVGYIRRKLNVICVQFWSKILSATYLKTTAKGKKIVTN